MNNPNSYWGRLGKELAYLIDVPIPKARKAVYAVHKALINAGLRGEEIKISGFGKFWAVDIKSRTVQAHPMGGYIARTRPRRTMRFHPSKALIRYINQEEPR
jgi:nucleoid DNA-binding protein